MHFKHSKIMMIPSRKKIIKNKRKMINPKSRNKKNKNKLTRRKRRTKRKRRKRKKRKARKDKNHSHRKMYKKFLNK